MLHNEQNEIKNSEPDNKKTITVLPDEMISAIVPHQDTNDALSFGKTSKKYNDLILNKKFYLNRFIFLNTKEAYENCPDKLKNNNNQGMLVRSVSNALLEGSNILSKAGGGAVILVYPLLVAGVVKGIGGGFFAMATRELISIDEVKNLPFYLNCCSSLSYKAKKTMLKKIVADYVAKASTFAISDKSFTLCKVLCDDNFNDEYRWRRFKEYMLLWDNNKNVYINNGKKFFGIAFAEVKSRVSPRLISAIEEALEGKVENKITNTMG